MKKGVGFCLVVLAFTGRQKAPRVVALRAFLAPNLKQQVEKCLRKMINQTK